MKSIVFRLALGFFCLIIFLVGQNMVAGKTARYISRVESRAQEQERRMDRLRLQLAMIRLNVYKLMATLDPAEMDRLTAEFSRIQDELGPQLLKSGAPKGLVESNFSLYHKAISLHYDFSVKTARALVNGPSKKVHEVLMERLMRLAAEKATANRREVASAKRDGELINIGLLAAALVTAIFWALLLARNLTDRGKAQQQLNDSRERLSLALAGADLATWDWDLAQKRLNLSPPWARRLGLNQTGAIADKHWLARIHPGDLKSATEAFERHASGHTAQYEAEMRVRQRDEEWVWLLTRGRVVERGPAGNPLRAAGTCLDITPKKQMEQAIQSSRKRLALAVGALNAAIWESTIPKTDDFYFSPRWAEILGWKKEELPQGKAVFSWWRGQMHPDDLEGFSLAERRFLQGEIARFSAQYRLRHRNGDWVWVQAVAEANERGPGGLPSRIIGLAFDVTESKKAQEAKTALEAQLHQASKMEAVGTLAGGIAHDFNNILGAIMGYAELARDAAESGAGHRGELAAILRAAERARDLVKQILTFSRKADPLLDYLDLNRLLEQVSGLLTHTLPKMINLRMAIAEEPMWVRGDPAQVEQVLLNLASNAADAMPDGGELTIATAREYLDEQFSHRNLEVSPGDYVRLSVADTGFGMDDQTLAQVFDPFFTTKEPGKGTGLGLSSVYGIVKTHGGHVRVESAPGQGTTFTIWLPAMESARQAIGPARASAAAGKGEGERILLVDDESSLRTIASQMLSRAGYRVATAETGEEALRSLRENGRIDLVILDLSMPGMGGKRCLEEILALFPEQKVLIASGYSREVTRNEVLAAGALDFLSKPYGREQLLAAVDQALGRAA